jgi:hypothetical protein
MPVEGADLGPVPEPANSVCDVHVVEVAEARRLDGLGHRASFGSGWTTAVTRPR